MTERDIFNKLKPFFADIFDVDEEFLSPEIDFFDDLFGDEYDFEEISLILEEEFDIKLKQINYKKVKTINDLICKIIKLKMK